MKNKHIKNPTYDESLLENATTSFMPITRTAVNDSHPETKQNRTTTETNDLVKPVKRERVYLHSIGRFSRLRKLQIGTKED